MSPFFKHVRQLFLLAIALPSAFAAQHEFDVGVATSTIRGGSMGVGVAEVHGRQLSSSLNWSWSNLLFHLGVCQVDEHCIADDHPHPPGPCGCPDCNKPHPPHFQNSYCENKASSSVHASSGGSSHSSSTNSGSSTSGSSTSGSSNSGSSNSGSSSSSSSYSNSNSGSTNSTVYDNSAANGGGQTPTRTFNAWILYGVGASVAAAVGVFAMRKRVVGRTGSGAGGKRGLSSAAANGSDYKLMGGMTAAFAAVMAKMGMKPTPDDASTRSGSSGAVSRRMSLLQKGGQVSTLQREASPSFIEIRKDFDAPRGMVDAVEGVEVDGPYRPSSHYAV